MFVENRLHPRAVVNLPARCRPRGAGDFEEVVIHDLSAGGAGILSRSAFEVQSEVELTFGVPRSAGGKPVDVEVVCLIVRAGRSPQQSSEHRHFAGLHFLTLDGDEFDSIRRYVWECCHDD